MGSFGLRALRNADRILAWPETLAWWDTDRSDLMTLNTAAVAGWKDSKAGYDCVAAGSVRPAYSATSFNGVPGVTLDGVDDCLTLASQPFPSGAASVEIWVVVSQDSLVAEPTTRHILSYGGDSLNDQVRLTRIVSGGVNRLIMGAGTGAAQITATAPGDFSGRCVIRCRVTPTAIFASVNGGAEAQTNGVPAIGTNRFRMGANANSAAGSFALAQYRDVLTLTPLSSEKATFLQNYLMARRML
jgi:hypothetical protein